MLIINIFNNGIITLYKFFNEMVIQLLSRIISFSLKTNILQLRGIGGRDHL